MPICAASFLVVGHARKDGLREDKDNQALLGRMSPIFDLDLFSSGAQAGDFARILRSSPLRDGKPQPTT